MIILTEKSSVAKDIANALTGFVFKDGYYQKDKDCIVAANGHLLNLAEPDEYDPKFKNWNIEDLPIIPKTMKYKVIENDKIKKIFFMIKKIFKEYDNTNFILATDAEREGCYIGALILDAIGFKEYSSAKRFWVSEALTQEVVLKGIQEAKPLSYYDSYTQAGYARSQSDWLIGINFSRLLSIATGTKITFGRVQSAVLGAIYLRDKNIENFKPEKYNELEITCKTKNSEDFQMILLDENKNDTKCVPNGTYIKNITSSLSENPNIIIDSITQEKKSELPPQLFNITGLQKYCSEKFKYSPEQTLGIAQKLYDQLKCLSYPRTPSKVLGDNNVDLYKSKYDLLKKEYPAYAIGCNEENINSNYKRIFNSEKLQDHHGLIPLDVLPSTASNEERNVYNSVLIRFFECIKEIHEYKNTTILGKLSNNNKIFFKCTGKEIVKKGWKAFYESKENILPALQENDNVNILKYEIKEKTTLPKKHFTSSSILALMENPKNEDDKTKLVGIGTPATRAGIIQNLITREYISCDKNQNLKITDKGKFIIDTVLKIPILKNIISIKTTTDWEDQLENTPDIFLENTQSVIKNELPKIQITDKWKKEEQQALGICPSCIKGSILIGKKNYYCSEYKNGCKFVLWKVFCGANISPRDVEILLSGNESKTKKFKSKNDKEFNAKIRLKESKIEFIFDNKT